MTAAGNERTNGAADADSLRALLDQLPVMVAAFEGPDHRFVVTNAAMRAFTNRDVVGLPVREAFPDVAGQQIFELADQVLESGTTLSIPEMRIQFGTDGSGAPLEFFVETTIMPSRGPDGTVTGVIAQYMDVTARVRERQAAQELASAAEQRAVTARSVVEQLQAALLPTGLPVLPGVQVAASYLLADADTAAGGDWFDAFPLRDGRVALIVGDVVGHGVAASATMGQLRVVLRERLAATGDLSTAVAAVDDLSTGLPGARAATVCVVVLDPDTGSLIYCTAGHPPPLLLPDDGDPRYLPLTGAGPLGVGSGFPVLTEQLDSAGTLLLYTDGILERPGREVAASTVELTRVAADAAADRVFKGEPGTAVDRLTTQTLELLTRVTGHSDDITLLAATRRSPVTPLRLVLPIGPDAITMARITVDDWIGLVGASEEDRVSMNHAVLELVTNACEHAYDHATGPSDRTGHSVTVTADLDAAGYLQLVVVDNGTWQEPAPAGADWSGRRRRGYGLAMTRALVDLLDIDHDDNGTTVTVRRKASHPARLLTPDHATHHRRNPTTGHPGAFHVLDLTDTPLPHIAVHGPLDATNVEELGGELDLLTKAGTRTLVVDLTAVTHLSSAAVAELHRTAPVDGHTNPLTLYAPFGSTAHHVLSLVNLQHITTWPEPDHPPTHAHQT